MHKRLVQFAFILGVITHGASAADRSPQTDWLKEARIGALDWAQARQSPAIAQP